MKIIAVIALAIFAVGCSNPVLDSNISIPETSMVEDITLRSTGLELVASRNVILDYTITYNDGTIDNLTKEYSVVDGTVFTDVVEIDGIMTSTTIDLTDWDQDMVFVSLPVDGWQYFMEFYTNGTSKRGSIDTLGTKFYHMKDTNGDGVKDAHIIYNWATQADSNNDNLREFAFYVDGGIRGYVNYTLEVGETEDCLSAWFNGAPTEGYKYYRAH